jgi:flagellar hook-length control protein FliK
VSNSRRVSPHRRPLCGMVQLHCWMPRTTDSVVMPFLALANLASTLASGAVNLAAHVADAASAASTKGTPAKQPGKAKTQPDAAALANVFAAYLAAASPPLAVPLVAATTAAAANLQKGQVNSTNGVPSIPTVAAVAANAAKGMPALMKPGSPSSATTAPVTPTPQANTVSHAPVVPRTAGNPAPVVPPTPVHPALPTPPLAVSHAPPQAAPTRTPTPTVRQPKLPSTPEKAAKPVAPNAPAPVLPHDGQGEAHLGIHTSVEPPALEPAPADQERTTTRGSPSAVVEAPAPAPRKIADASGDTGTPRESLPSPPVALAAQGPTHPPSPEVTPVEDKPHLASLSRIMQTVAALHSSGAMAPTARSAPAPTHHDDSRSQVAAPSSTPSGSTVAVNIAAPPAANLASPHSSPSSAPLNVPVAEQLTRAFVAQADVVQRQGQTNFHLRLDPPQLGSVQIHLTATDHTVSARIVVAQAGTQQLLQSHAHHLRQGLAEAGLSLGSFDVTRDGGGSRGNRQAPPEPPLLLPGFVSPPRTATASSPMPRPTDGIDLLA